MTADNPLPARHGKGHDQPKWPTWVIAGVGLVVTVVGIIWAGTIYDSHGRSILGGDVGKILLALIGLIGTLGAIYMQRSVGAIRHQVHNNGGGSMKDSVDRIEATLPLVLSSLNRLNVLPLEVARIESEVSNQGAVLATVASEVEGQKLVLGAVQSEVTGTGKRVDEHIKASEIIVRHLTKKELNK